MIIHIDDFYCCINEFNEFRRLYGAYHILPFQKRNPIPIPSPEAMKGAVYQSLIDVGILQIDLKCNVTTPPPPPSPDPIPNKRGF